MDNNALVSVIVPNYNHEKYLIQRLDSIFNQTYENFEVILLDDCSTDNSRVILSEYAENPKVTHCIFNEINTGNTFIQWNKGISIAKGEYIWIAESDDYSSPDFIKKTIKPLISNKEIVLSYCQSNRVNENGEVTGNWLNHTADLNKEKFLVDFIMDGNAFIENFLIFKNVIPNASAVIFKKESVLKINHINLDPFLKYNGDWLFYLKIITNNKIAFLKDSLNNFRYHSQSVITSGFDNKPISFKIKINIFFRKSISIFMKKQKIGDLKKIIKINDDLLKRYKYKMAIIDIKNNKIVGYFQIMEVLDVAIKDLFKYTSRFSK